MSCRICGAFARLDNKQAVADELGITRSAVWHHLKRGRCGRPHPAPEEIPVETTPPDYPFAPVRRPHTRLVEHPGPLPRTVVQLNDLHLPGVHERAFDAACRYIDDARPDLVVINGDLMDFHSISDYDKPDMTRLQEEIDRSRPHRKRLEGLPGKKVVLMGNHDERCERLSRKNKAYAGLQALEFGNLALIDPSWELYADQTHYRIGNLLFLHGNVDGGPRGGVHIADAMRAHLKHSCIFGHFHRDGTARPQVDYDGEPVNEGHAIGWMGDALTAGRYIRKSDATVGFATIHFDGDAFDVDHHVWKRGRFLIQGKRYS